MISETSIPLSDLLLDPNNPRLKEKKEGQPETVEAMLDQFPDKVYNLAKDIIDKGMLNPFENPGVIPTKDDKKRYTVVEGNRRIAALKILETPELSKKSSKKLYSKFNKLSKKYHKSPISDIKCTVFPNLDEALHWIKLKHTGEQNGVGPVLWGTREQENFVSRYEGKTYNKQVIDFVKEKGSLSPEANASLDKIALTNLQRILADSYIQNKLGFRKNSGVLETYLPHAEIADSFTKIIEDLALKKINVTDIERSENRKNYIEQFQDDILPNKENKLEDYIAIDDSVSTDLEGNEKNKKNKKSKRRKSKKQTALIAHSCNLDIDNPRINEIYIELKQLSADQYPNACAVLLRVFIELSSDFYLENAMTWNEQKIRNTSLAKKIGAIGNKLRGEGIINKKQDTYIQKVSRGDHSIAASVTTMHQYIHNEYFTTNPIDLRKAFNSMLPFLKGIWNNQ